MENNNQNSNQPAPDQTNSPSLPNLEPHKPKPKLLLITISILTFFAIVGIAA